MSRRSSGSPFAHARRRSSTERSSSVLVSPLTSWPPEGLPCTPGVMCRDLTISSRPAKPGQQCAPIRSTGSARGAETAIASRWPQHGMQTAPSGPRWGTGIQSSCGTEFQQLHCQPIDPSAGCGCSQPGRQHRIQPQPSGDPATDHSPLPAGHESGGAIW